MTDEKLLLTGYGAAGIEMGGMLAGCAVAGVPAFGCGAYHGYGGSHGYGGAPGYGHGKFQHGKFGKPFAGKFNKRY